MIPGFSLRMNVAIANTAAKGGRTVILNQFRTQAEAMTNIASFQENSKPAE